MTHRRKTHAVRRLLFPTAIPGKKKCFQHAQVCTSLQSQKFQCSLSGWDELIYNPSLGENKDDGVGFYWMSENICKALIIIELFMANNSPESPAHKTEYMVKPKQANKVYLMRLIAVVQADIGLLCVGRTGIGCKTHMADLILMDPKGKICSTIDLPV